MKKITLFSVLLLFISSVVSCQKDDDHILFPEQESEETEEAVPEGAYRTRIQGSDTYFVWVDDTTSLVCYYKDKRESFYKKLTDLNAKVRKDTAEDLISYSDTIDCVEVTVSYKVLKKMEEVAYAVPFIWRYDPKVYGGLSKPDLGKEIYCKPSTKEQKEIISKFAKDRRLMDLGMQTWGLESAYVLMCWKDTDGFILDLINELTELKVGGVFIPGKLSLDVYIPWRELRTGKLY